MTKQLPKTLDGCNVEIKIAEPVPFYFWKEAPSSLCKEARYVK